LNSLVEEYVNLAYHGMRAGKNPIKVNIDLELDEKVGEVNLIQEDFSRVILNLCNNAFDALREKLSHTTFSPRLLVGTSRHGQKVTVKISDNGPGIPEDLRTEFSSLSLPLKKVPKVPV
jgi:signal transduction histidine kinase